jgi:hypothetical protein
VGAVGFSALRVVSGNWWFVILSCICLFMKLCFPLCSLTWTLSAILCCSYADHPSSIVSVFSIHSEVFATSRYSICMQSNIHILHLDHFLLCIRHNSLKVTMKISWVYYVWYKPTIINAGSQSSLHFRQSYHVKTVSSYKDIWQRLCMWKWPEKMKITCLKAWRAD